MGNFAQKQNGGAGFFSQTATMIKRNFTMLRNQKMKIFTLLVIPLICAMVVTFVASKNMFEYYNGTLSGFLTLICACIFTGVFNTIAEIYPERDIVRREYAACLNLDAYIAAKMIVQWVICLIQALILFGMMQIFVDFPSKGVVFRHSFPEYFVTIYLLMLASDAMGLMISSMVKSASSASIVAPVLLIAQMAFSGALFELKGLSKWFSSLMVSRWAMEAVGSTGRLNDLPINIKDMPEEIMEMFPDLGHQAHKFNDAYDPTVSHVVTVWLILLGFGCVCTFVSARMLRRIVKDSRS